MKQILFFFGFTALLFFTQDAQAQRQKGRKDVAPAQRAQALTKKMTKKLTLDAVQEERVHALNEIRFDKVEAAKATKANDKKAFREARKAIMADYQSQLQEILTAEQWASYQTMKEEKKARGANKMKKRKAYKHEE